MSILLEDIIEKLENGESIENCGIEVEKYISILIKQEIIKGDEEKVYGGIIGDIIIEDSGFFYVDEVMKEILMKVSIVIYYSNINVPDNVSIQFYDKLKKYHIDEYVIMRIPQKEYDLFISLTDKLIKSHTNLLNSPQRLTNKYISELIKKIPDEKEIKKLIKNVKNFDEGKLKTIKDLFTFTKEK